DRARLAEHRRVPGVAAHRIEQPDWIDRLEVAGACVLEQGERHGREQQRGEVEGVGGPHRHVDRVTGWRLERLSEEHAGIGGEAHVSRPWYRSSRRVRT